MGEERDDLAALRAAIAACRICRDQPARGAEDRLPRRLVANGANAENDFEAEQHLRLTILEVLYTRRRTEPERPALSPLDLEGLVGTAREHLEFTLWFLIQKKHVTRSDNSMLVITAEGVEHLESNYRENVQRRRLQAAPVTAR